MRFALTTSLFALSACMILASPAMAEPFTYAPDGCEITSTFPEKPFFQTKCSGPENARDCSEIVTYTKTDIATGSSINFRLSCRVEEAAELEKYTPEIVEETLRQMITSAGLEPYNIVSNAEDGFRKSSALSIGEKGGKEEILSGQIWIGKSSMFTLEAGMLGPKNEKLETIFADILRNTHAKNMVPNLKKMDEKKAEVKKTPDKKASEENEKGKQ